MVKFINVRLTGIEPAHRKILDPKSSASANSATGAKSGAKVRKNFGFFIHNAQFTMHNYDFLTIATKFLRNMSLDDLRGLLSGNQ